MRLPTLELKKNQTLFYLKVFQKNIIFQHLSRLMAGVRLIISEETTLLIYSGPLVTKLQTMREGGGREVAEQTEDSQTYC